MSDVSHQGRSDAEGILGGGGGLREELLKINKCLQERDEKGGEERAGFFSRRGTAVPSFFEAAISLVTS